MRVEEEMAMVEWGGVGVEILGGGGGRWTQDVTLRDQRGGHIPSAQLTCLSSSPGPSPCPPLCL